MPSGPLHWPALGPILPEDKTAIGIQGGHPTAAGPLDRDRAYPRLPVDTSPQGGGIPGRPKYRSRGVSHGKMGSMLPGATTNGPKQPGVDYDDGNIA
jgi:hypothetical protein